MVSLPSVVFTRPARSHLLMTAATRNRCTLPNPARNWLLTLCSFRRSHLLVVSLWKPNRFWVNFLEELMIAGFGLATLCCSALGGRSFWGGRFLHMHWQQQLLFFLNPFCISLINWASSTCVDILCANIFVNSFETQKGMMQFKSAVMPFFLKNWTVVS